MVRATARWLAIAFFIEIKIDPTSVRVARFPGFSEPRSSFVLWGARPVTGLKAWNNRRVWQSRTGEVLRPLLGAIFCCRPISQPKVSDRIATKEAK